MSSYVTKKDLYADIEMIEGLVASEVSRSNIMRIGSEQARSDIFSMIANELKDLKKSMRGQKEKIAGMMKYYIEQSFKDDDQVVRNLKYLDAKDLVGLRMDLDKLADQLAR